MGGGGVTLCQSIVMVFSPRNIVGCLHKKRLTKGGVTGTPGPPLATPLPIFLKFPYQEFQLNVTHFNYLNAGNVVKEKNNVLFQRFFLHYLVRGTMPIDTPADTIKKDVLNYQIGFKQ